MKLNPRRLTWGVLLVSLLPLAPAAAEEPQHIHGGGTPHQATVANVQGAVEIRRFDEGRHEIQVLLTDVSGSACVRDAVVHLEITQMENDEDHGGGMGKMGMGHHGHGGDHSHGGTGELTHLSTVALKGEEAGTYVYPWAATPGRHRITATIEMANGQVLSPPLQLSTVYKASDDQGGSGHWGHIVGYGALAGIAMVAVMAAMVGRL